MCQRTNKIDGKKTRKKQSVVTYEALHLKVGSRCVPPPRSLGDKKKKGKREGKGKGEKREKKRKNVPASRVIKKRVKRFLPFLD